MLQPLLVLLCILSVVSCREASEMSEKQRALVIEEVRQTLNNYCSDIKKSGLGAEFRYLDSTADFSWVPPGYTAPISYDSVASVLKQNAAHFRSIENTFVNLKIIPLNSELASYTGRITSTMTDTTGKATTYRLVETGIMIKRNSGWKLLNGQTAIINQ